MISQDRDATELIHSVDGKTIQTVTRDELAQELNKTDLTVIITYEKRMSQLFDQWVEITKDISLVDARDRGRYKAQSAGISDDMGDCLTQVFTLLSTVGFKLDDHYAALKAVAAQGMGSRS